MDFDLVIVGSDRFSLCSCHIKRVGEAIANLLLRVLGSGFPTDQKEY